MNEDLCLPTMTTYAWTAHQVRAPALCGQNARMATGVPQLCAQALPAPKRPLLLCSFPPCQSSSSYVPLRRLPPRFHLPGLQRCCRGSLAASVSEAAGFDGKSRALRRPTLPPGEGSFQEPV